MKSQLNIMHGISRNEFTDVIQICHEKCYYIH